MKFHAEFCHCVYCVLRTLRASELPVFGGEEFDVEPGGIGSYEITHDGAAVNSKL